MSSLIPTPASKKKKLNDRRDLFTTELVRWAYLAMSQISIHTMTSRVEVEFHSMCVNMVGDVRK